MLSATQKEHQMTMRIWYKIKVQSKNNVTVPQPLANADFSHVSICFKNKEIIRKHVVFFTATVVDGFLLLLSTNHAIINLHLHSLTFYNITCLFKHRGLHLHVRRLLPFNTMSLPLHDF